MEILDKTTILVKNMNFDKIWSKIEIWVKKENLVNTQNFSKKSKF